jgi:uncharacterized protein (DUF488 family)
VLPAVGGEDRLMHPLFTIGHSTRALEELIALLRESHIEMLVDVRAFPRSRRQPQFNIDTLPDALQAAGIGYRHMQALGGRRPKSEEPSLNGLWREAGFRNYADYALTPVFHRAFDALADVSQQHRAAVMCAEAVWWRCHRRIITDYALAHGIPVKHIMGPGDVQDASITPGAVPQESGAVLYPPPEKNPAQGRLL